MLVTLALLCLLFGLSPLSFPCLIIALCMSYPHVMTAGRAVRDYFRVADVAPPAARPRISAEAAKTIRAVAATLNAAAPTATQTSTAVRVLTEVVRREGLHPGDAIDTVKAEIAAQHETQTHITEWMADFLTEKETPRNYFPAFMNTAILFWVVVVIYLFPLEYFLYDLFHSVIPFDVFWDFVYVFLGAKFRFLCCCVLLAHQGLRPGSFFRNDLFLRPPP